jgi:hypothetical protein
MDYSWIATRGIDTDKVLRTLGLVDTGERTGFTDGEYCAVELPTGFFVVQTTTDDENFLETDLVEALSEEGEAYLCIVGEDAMTSILLYSKGGEAEWVVSHDGEEGADHLDIEGELPPVFAVLRDRALEDAKADEEPAEFFSLPVELGLAQTGYEAVRDLEGVEPGQIRVLSRLD